MQNLFYWIREMTDLVTSFIACRVLPLQHRVHIIGRMGDHRDVTQMSTGRLAPEQVADRVNSIFKERLASDWRFGKAPYNAKPPTPTVSPWSPFFSMS